MRRSGRWRSLGLAEESGSCELRYSTGAGLQLPCLCQALRPRGHVRLLVVMQRPPLRMLLAQHGL